MQRYQTSCEFRNASSLLFLADSRLVHSPQTSLLLFVDLVTLLCTPSHTDQALFFADIESDHFALPPFAQLMSYRVVLCSCLDASILLRARASNEDLGLLEASTTGTIHRGVSIEPHWTHLLIDEVRGSLSNGTLPRVLDEDLTLLLFARFRLVKALSPSFSSRSRSSFPIEEEINLRKENLSSFSAEIPSNLVPSLPARQLEAASSTSLSWNDSSSSRSTLPRVRSSLDLSPTSSR